MKTSDLLKCQILQNQIKSLMIINNEIAKQINLEKERLHEVNNLQKSVNEQLDIYKKELSIFDEIVLSNDDCARFLGLS